MKWNVTNVDIGMVDVPGVRKSLSGCTYIHTQQRLLTSTRISSRHHYVGCYYDLADIIPYGVANATVSPANPKFTYPYINP